MITRTASRALKRAGFELTKRKPFIPSTQRVHLELLEKNGSDREWHQVMMYAHIMDLTKDTPGDIIEFGTASGTSLMAFVRMNNIYNRNRPHDVAKKSVYGFDSFEGLPELDKTIDLGNTDGREYGDMKQGGFDSRSTLADLEKFCADNSNCSIHKGWFSDTLPGFLETKQHISFSVIHIDCDIYASTLDALSPCIKRLNVGGVILFDEIFHEKFPGETAAFWEIYNKLDGEIRLKFNRVHSMPWKWYCIREQ